MWEFVIVLYLNWDFREVGGWRKKLDVDWEIGFVFKDISELERGREKREKSGFGVGDLEEERLWFEKGLCWSDKDRKRCIYIELKLVHPNYLPDRVPTWCLADCCPVHLLAQCSCYSHAVAPFECLLLPSLHHGKKRSHRWGVSTITTTGTQNRGSSLTRGSAASLAPLSNPNPSLLSNY